jgi:hypothetical protein
MVIKKDGGYPVGNEVGRNSKLIAEQAVKRASGRKRNSHTLLEKREE